MRILLLGATGVMGRRTATELLRHDAVERLTLAGRNEGTLRALADRVRGRAEVAVEVFDLTSEDAATHFEGHDLIVSCAGPGYLTEVPAVDGAIAKDADYISLNDDLEAATAVAERHDEATERGVTVVSGCGVGPGLANLLSTLAASELDEVDDVEISVAASTRDAGGAATELHFVAMLDAAVHGGNGSDGSLSPHPVYFPEPVGWVETFPARHPTVPGVQQSLQGAPTVRFRAGLGEKAVMDILRVGIAARLASGHSVRQAWLGVSRPIRPLLERFSPTAAPWTALRVDVHGTRSGKRTTVALGVVDHLTNLTSLTLATAAVSLPALNKPGVRTVDELYEPRMLLKDVAARGVRFARLEPHDW